MKLPLRQVHLDFHTSPHVAGVGADFDPEIFAETLSKARVNSITCFARCHHGYLYYDSKAFPERVHPGLVRKDLLTRQLMACHARGIRAPIYITVQWDDFTARQHPEWLCRGPSGALLGLPFDHGTGEYEAGFYRALCVRSPYLDFLKAQVREVLETLDPVDGLFFDIIFTNPCACPRCTAGIVALGLNPADEQTRLAYALDTLNEFVRDMTAFVHAINPSAAVFYNKSHVGAEHRAVCEAYTHFELESLPGSPVWGYMHFPVAARYARTLGKPCLGMTGKFHTEWGDFGSYKNQAALEYEVFRMLALGAGCIVGDQMEPRGSLSPVAYDLIGAVYGQVERVEPWCVDAGPLVDIGVLTPEEFLPIGANPMTPAILGASRMLTEGGHQFDIIDTQSDFSRYKVLILPDHIPGSPLLEQKLNDYLASGGKVLASFESGMNEKKDAFSLSAIPAVPNPVQARDREGQLVRGRKFAAFDYADYIRPASELSRGLQAREYVMYMRGVRVLPAPGAQALADTVVPYFDRTWEHYFSHRQTPPSAQTDGPAVISREGVIYFAHPIFGQYAHSAPLWCKRLLLNALELLLPEPLLRHGGPSTLLATVNRQAKREGRYVVHLLHYIPERRCESLDIIEDTIPLYNLRLSLRLSTRPISIDLVPEAAALGFTYENGRAELTIPEILGHQMLCVTFEEPMNTAPGLPIPSKKGVIG